MLCKKIIFFCRHKKGVTTTTLKRWTTCDDETSLKSSKVNVILFRNRQWSLLSEKSRIGFFGVWVIIIALNNNNSNNEDEDYVMYYDARELKRGTTFEACKYRTTRGPHPALHSPCCCCCCRVRTWNARRTTRDMQCQLKALVTLDIYTHNIAIKRYLDKKIILSHGFLLAKVSS